jgi:hypothetical protein
MRLRCTLAGFPSVSFDNSVMAGGYNFSVEEIEVSRAAVRAVLLAFRADGLRRLLFCIVAAGVRHQEMRQWLRAKRFPLLVSFNGGLLWWKIC